MQLVTTTYKDKTYKGVFEKKLKVEKLNQEIIPNFRVQVPEESKKLVMEVLDSGWIGGDGPKVKEFEKKIGEMIGSEQILAVNSGTSGLQLALKAINVSGGEVISTPMTCFATNAAIVQEGANLVWADVDPATGNIDPYDIAKRITRKTKAIMMVHWGGHPCEIEMINKIADIFKIPVIEDAAQALGSEYNGKPIGTHSDYVVFSTQAIKILNTADGGLISVKDKEKYEMIKRLRWYGIDRDARVQGPTFWHYPISEVGSKMQMTDINAALGLGQLSYLKENITHRRKLAKIYDEAVKKSKTLNAQQLSKNSKPNYWIYTVLCGDNENRLRLYEELKKINVKAEEAHRRNDLYPVFSKYNREELPGVKLFDETELIIPIGPWVTEQKAQQIAKILSKFK